MTYKQLGFSVEIDFYLDLTEQPQKMIFSRLYIKQKV